MDRRCGGMEFERGAALLVPDPPEDVGSSVSCPERGAGLRAWLDAMQEVGGWEQAGLPGVDEQLERVLERPADLVICVGLDRYPPFSIRGALLRTYPNEVMEGLELLASLSGAKIRMLAMDRGMSGGRVIRRLARERGVRRLSLSAVYPAADPTLIAWHTATGGRRRLAPGCCPTTVGMVMVDPWLCVRLARWLRSGRLERSRPVWVAEDVASTEGVIRWLAPGPLDESILRGGAVACGDPLSGRVLEGRRLSGDVEAIFGVSGSVSWRAPEPCIQCGWCAEVCPTHLRPIELVRVIERDRRVDPKLDWCLDCGLCTRVCPSAIDLATVLRGRHVQRESCGD
ncbi:4Fe-4S dicluster domain-containing protein [Mucisphaera calidilacus]|uniref:Electron transport complex protein RnfC n=1 Tax=Mucisphaera calidilacus TaxID=2527982 RepID=A0A518BV03_9BACT|nr:4Fe-4S dicluster domain-containing protein [Mucisphaera calidilacus]QDU70810.1 electron transport complex protein RnfC [Mucisphaera calidilacus]